MYQLPCLTIKVNGKLEQSNPGMITNNPNPSGIKICATLSDKQAQQDKVLMKGEMNEKWVVEKELVNTSYGQVNSYKNEDYNYHEYFLILSLSICMCDLCLYSFPIPLLRNIR